MSVSINVVYVPPSDAVLGANEYRAASTVELNCQVEGATGRETFEWTSTCDGCFADGPTVPSVRQEQLRSIDNGTHTCTVTLDRITGSVGIVMNVVGKFNTFAW